MSSNSQSSKRMSVKELKMMVTFWGLVIILVLSALTFRFPEQGEVAFVRGKRALPLIDSRTAVKLPWEETSYVTLGEKSCEIKLSLNESRAERKVAQIDEDDQGFELVYNLSYLFDRMDDEIAKVAEANKGPLNYHLNRLIVASHEEANIPGLKEVEDKVRAEFKRLGLPLKSFSVQSKPVIGKQRLHRIQAIGIFALDAGLPIRLSAIIEDPRWFEALIRDWRYNPDAYERALNRFFTKPKSNDRS